MRELVFTRQCTAQSLEESIYSLPTPSETYASLSLGTNVHGIAESAAPGQRVNICMMRPLWSLIQAFLPVGIWTKEVVGG